MSNKRLTMIVPRLPPAINGLGDYGFFLAQEMKKQFGVEVDFIVADPEWNGESIENFPVKKITEYSAMALLSLLPKDQAVLLHYVGYGYAKRGCPSWLVSALETWKSLSNKNILITMFHELYAYGRPFWTVQFWLAPFQKKIASRLGVLSDHCLTSKNGYAEILKNLTKGKHSNTSVLPVFSNVGEPQNLSSLDQRERRIVIFGSKSSRSRVYQSSFTDLKNLCKAFKITEIVDLGPELSIDIDPIDGVIIKKLGIKSSEEISNILAHSLIGYINYPAEFLAKSGIFAAYSSHRLLPIVSNYEGQKEDGVIENVHYWVGNKHFSEDLSQAQPIADNVYCWYQEHRLAMHAKTFFQFF